MGGTARRRMGQTHVRTKRVRGQQAPRVRSVAPSFYEWVRDGEPSPRVVDGDGALVEAPKRRSPRSASGEILSPADRYKPLVGQRVIVMINRIGVSGTQPQPAALIRALKDAGAAVTAVSLQPVGDLAEELGGEDIEVFSLGSPRKFTTLRSIPSAAKLFRRLKPDALVAFLYECNVAGRIAGRLARVPVIVSSIRNEYFGGWFREAVFRATNRFDTTTTTNSRLAARGLVKRRVVTPQKLVVTRNGIDLDSRSAPKGERRRVRAALEIPSSAFVWLTVGRLIEQKDHGTLLNTMARLRKRHPSSVLLIAGAGPNSDELEMKANSLGLADCVRFLGLRKDVPELMAAADAFVMSSRWEGTPNAMIEALASRLPVVSTNVGGVAELVDDGVSGLLVAAEDASELADAMSRVSSMNSLDRKRMGAAGRDHVVEHFEMQKAMNTWVGLLADRLGVT
jgi:glycosyltransferase involved in cell wall biosynthesis